MTPAANDVVILKKKNLEKENEDYASERELYV